MLFQEITKELDNRIYRPVYFLCGEENYYIDVITDRIEKEILTEDEKAFNLTILYGNETNVAYIADAARRFPMLSEKQVIIVKEAQNLRDWDNLTPYLDKYQPAAVLLFAFRGKKPDKRKAVFKKLSTQKDIAYLETARIYDNMVPAWINNSILAGNRKVSKAGVLMLSESLGTDLGHIANEINKLFTLVPEQGTISESLIESLIGISREYNNFELIEALLKKDSLKANRIVNYFESNPKKNPLPVTIALLFRFFNNLLTFHYSLMKGNDSQGAARAMGLRPMELRDCQTGIRQYSARKCANIIALLRETDLKSKGSGGIAVPDAELLRELIFRILN